MKKNKNRILLGIITLLCIFSINNNVYATISKPNHNHNNNNNNSDIISVCSYVQLYSLINKEVNNITNTVNNLYLPEILQYTNATGEEYQNLLNNYNNFFSELIDSSMQTIASAIKEYQCDFGSDYETLLNYFGEEALKTNNLLNDTISSKLLEAKETAEKNGESTRNYLNAQLFLKRRRDGNETKINEAVAKDIEEYKIFIDEINNNSSEDDNPFDNNPSEDDNNDDMVEAGNCPDILLPVFKLIRRILTPIISIGIPILLILMGSIDLGKAVMASDDRGMKEATSKFLRRCIAAIAVFFVVTIVTILMNMLSKVDEIGEQNGWKSCWNEAGK